MASYNRVIMVGNLTRDPEFKHLASGQAICRLGLATNRQFKNRQTGEMVQEVCFVDIDVWGAQAENCNQYLQKGRLVLIEGRLKFDMWQDNDGQRRSKHLIVADRVTFLSSSSYDTTSPQETEDSMTIPESKGFGPAAAAMPNKMIDEMPKKNTSVSQEMQAAPAIDAKASTGEVDFKEEEPFKDDLPF